MPHAHDQRAGPPGTGDPPNSSTAELGSLSRRRILLRGMGKAGAVAGAALPLRSLALGDKPGMRLSKNDPLWYQCSVSGQASVLHSATVAQPIPTCKGSPLGTYKSSKNVAGQTVWLGWPTVAGCPTPTATFASVFIQSTLTTQVGALIDAGTTDAAHWVVALLNAYKLDATFPYSPAEVKALYALDAVRQAAALTFFKTYLET